MVTRLRRRLAGALARWAVRIDPDPGLSFTTSRRIDQDYPDLDLLDSVTFSAIANDPRTERRVAGPAFDPTRY